MTAALSLFRLAYLLTRWKNVGKAILFYWLSQTYPQTVRGWLRAWAQEQLPDGFAVDVHFKPKYDPWDQRLCAVPNGTNTSRDLSRGPSPNTWPPLSEPPLDPPPHHTQPTPTHPPTHPQATSSPP